MKVLTDERGNQWEVIEAESDEAAWDAIAAARCTGSVGSCHEVYENGVSRITANVRRLADRESGVT